MGSGGLTCSDGARCGNPAAGIVLSSEASTPQLSSILEPWLCVPTGNTRPEVLKFVPSPCTSSGRQFQRWGPEVSEVERGRQVGILAALLWFLCSLIPSAVIRLPFG